MLGLHYLCPRIQIRIGNVSGIGPLFAYRLDNVSGIDPLFVYLIWIFSFGVLEVL